MTIKVTIAEDQDCEMLKISVGNECVFEGNYWDFQHRDIINILKSCKIPATLTIYKYDDQD